MRLWFLYCLKEMAKLFFLFIFSFYFLYVLIDYSTHAKSFTGAHFDALLYYLFQFTHRLDILVPVALLVASLKVQTTLNTRREFTAMLTSGVRVKKLLIPFMFAALLCAGLLITNFQLFQPKALVKLDQFEKQIFSQRKKGSKKHPVHQLKLQDNSLFVYQSYDPEQKHFFDAYWIQSVDHLYRIKYFNPHTSPPVGTYVDEITRDQSGKMVLENRSDTLVFPTLLVDSSELFAAATPPKSWSISALFRSISWQALIGSHADQRGSSTKIATQLCYKCLMPLLCFLVVLAPAPYALQFGRHTPLFLIYALALFGILVFFTLIGSALILSESGVLPPLWTLLSPFVLTLFLFIPKSIRM